MELKDKLQAAEKRMNEVYEVYRTSADARYEVYHASMTQVYADLKAKYGDRWWLADNHKINDKRLAENAEYQRLNAEADAAYAVCAAAEKEYNELAYTKSRNVAIDLGLVDNKGRRIGLNVHLYEHFVVEGDAVITEYTVCAKATRNGNGFGAAQPDNTFSSDADRVAYIEKRRKATLATYSRKFKEYNK